MFKKIIIITAISLCATSAFAGGPAAALKGFAQSKNVDLDYDKGPSGCTNGCDRWGAVTQHKSGDKNYYTSNAYGGLALKTVVPGTAIGSAAVPNSATDSTLPTDWKQI